MLALRLERPHVDAERFLALPHSDISTQTASCDETGLSFRDLSGTGNCVFQHNHPVHELNVVYSPVLVQRLPVDIGWMFTPVFVHK